jgi:hypothetical protein
VTSLAWVSGLFAGCGWGWAQAGRWDMASVDFALSLVVACLMLRRSVG